MDASGRSGWELGDQNLSALRQLSRAADRGERHDVVDDQVDVSVGRGKGSLRSSRWIRRDPP